MKKITISKELKIGVFTIIILATGYWGVNFLRGVDVLSASNKFYAYYDQSDNIEISAPVLVKGIKIGAVTKVSIESVESKVRVEMLVHKKYKIPANSIAELTDKSFTGGKAIALVIGDSEEILESKDVIESRVNNKMQKQIEEAKGMLISVVTNLNTTLDNVNKLLAEENIASITSTLDNVSRMTNTLDKVIKKESVKISNITSDLEDITSDFKGTMPALNNTLANLDSITATIKNSNLDQTIIAANNSIASLNSTLDGINNGTGTVSLLMNDPALYNNISSLLSDLQENPKRYVHFSLFGRKDKK